MFPAAGSEEAVPAATAATAATQCPARRSCRFLRKQKPWRVREFNLLLRGLQMAVLRQPSAQLITVTRSIPGKCVSWGTNSYSLTPVTIEKTIESVKGRFETGQWSRRGNWCLEEQENDRPQVP